MEVEEDYSRSHHGLAGDGSREIDSDSVESFDAPAFRRDKGKEQEEEEEEEVDAYESLAHSERIVNGSVQLDWSALPPSLRASVPGAPSAVKQSQAQRRRLSASVAGSNSERRDDGRRQNNIVTTSPTKRRASAAPVLPSSTALSSDFQTDLLEDVTQPDAKQPVAVTRRGSVADAIRRFSAFAAPTAPGNSTSLNRSSLAISVSGNPFSASRRRSQPIASALGPPSTSHDGGETGLTPAGELSVVVEARRASFQSPQPLSDSVIDRVSLARHSARGSYEDNALHTTQSVRASTGPAPLQQEPLRHAETGLSPTTSASNLRELLPSVKVHNTALSSEASFANFMQAAGDQDGDFDTVAYGAESGQSAFLTSTASLSHFLDEGVEHMPFESPAKDSVQGMTPSEEYLFNFMKESGLPQKSQYTNLHSLDYLPPGVSGANDFLDDFPSGDGKRVSIDNHFYDEELRYSTSNDVSASIARAEDATSYNSLLHGYGDESAASSSHYLPAHAAIAPLGPNNRVQFISKRSPAESRSRVSFSNDSTELGAHVNGNTTTRIAPEHLAVIPKPAQSPPVIEPQQLMTFRSATVSEIVRSDAAEIQSARGSTIRATLKRQSTVPGLKQDDSGVLGLSLANERPSMAQPLEVIPSRQSMAQKQGIASVRQLTEKEIATPRQSIVKKPESASVRQSMVQKPGSAPVQQSMVYNPESASVRQSMVQKPESAPVRQSMVQKPGTTSSIESTVQKPETGSDRQSMAKNPEHLSARQSEVQQRLASAGPTMTRRQSVVHRFDEDVLSHKEALISEARSLQTPEIAAPKTQTHPQTRIETACYQPNLSFAALRASIGSRATPPTALSVPIATDCDTTRFEDASVDPETVRQEAFRAGIQAASVDMQARARDVMRELLTGKDAFTFHHCKFEYRGPVRVEQEPLVVGAARVPVSVAGGERTIRTNGSSQTDASNLDSVLGRLSRMSVPSPKARSGENDSIDLGPDLTMSDLSAPNAKDNSGWGSFLASRGGSTRALGTSSQSWIREDQNRDEHSAHEASETKDGEDDGDTDENERPAPKQFRRTQPEARFSQFSKRTRDPISFRPTERILRKRANELDMVNAELVHLSRVLADKKDQLKRREDALDIREHQIAEAQERLELDVQDLVRERTVERDECLKREIEALIQSSDASIASLAKENRRLVVSNKEMAGANRRLRDQSRLFMAAINERDVREFELHNQIKQQKDRIERLKKNLGSLKPSNLVIERTLPTATSFFGHQFHEKGTPKPHKLGKTASTQTNSGQLIEGVSEKPLQQVPQFLSSNNEALTDAILVLLRTHFMVLQVEEEEGAETTQSVLRSVFLSNSHEICKPLAEALPKLATHCWNSEKSAMLFSLYATYALEFSRGLEKVCAEQSILANAAWRICFGPDFGQIPLRGRIALHLLVLSDISSHNATRCEKAILDVATSLTKSDDAKRLFVSLDALELICPLLESPHSTLKIQFVVSSLFLTMCGDGDWQESFLGQCGESEALIQATTSVFMNSLSEESVGLHENIAALLQQLSRNPHAQALIKNNDLLCAKLKELSEQEDTLSEFLKLNVCSIWQNLDFSTLL